MNYKKIHDAIISRAQGREYNSTIHHKHHITPFHEDPLSVDTVVLTIKEHALVHKLRYKFVGTTGNLLAYYLIKNISLPSQIASEAGKLGSKTLIENKLGIFSEDWDRSAETKRRWEQGIIDRDVIVNRMKRDAQSMGRRCYDLKLGAHSPDRDRSVEAKLAWLRMSTDAKDLWLLKNQRHAKARGNASRDKKAGFHGLDTSQKKLNSSLGGKACGKLPCWTDGVSNKKTAVCPGEGWRRGRVMRHKTTKQLTVYYKEDI